MLLLLSIIATIAAIKTAYHFQKKYRHERYLFLSKEVEHNLVLRDFKSLSDQNMSYKELLRIKQSQIINYEEAMNEYEKICFNWENSFQELIDQNESLLSHNKKMIRIIKSNSTPPDPKTKMLSVEELKAAAKKIDNNVPHYSGNVFVNPEGLLCISNDNVVSVDVRPHCRNTAHGSISSFRLASISVKSSAPELFAMLKMNKMISGEYTEEKYSRQFLYNLAMDLMDE